MGSHSIVSRSRHHATARPPRHPPARPAPRLQRLQRLESPIVFGTEHAVRDGGLENVRRVDDVAGATVRQHAWVRLLCESYGVSAGWVGTNGAVAAAATASTAASA